MLSSDRKSIWKVIALAGLIALVSSWLITTQNINISSSMMLQYEANTLSFAGLYFLVLALLAYFWQKRVSP